MVVQPLSLEVGNVNWRVSQFALPRLAEDGGEQGCVSGSTDGDEQTKGFLKLPHMGFEPELSFSLKIWRAVASKVNRR